MTTTIRLPKQVITSDAYNQLGAWSVKLLVDAAKQYNGSNNGDLHAAWSILSGQGWRSKGTLSRAIKELIDKGFIEQTRQGGKNRCSLYAITWKPIDECKGKLDVKEPCVASKVRERYNKMLNNDSLMWEGLGPDGIKGDYTETSREIASAIYARDTQRLGQLLLTQVDDYIYEVAEAHERYDDDGELRAHIANSIPF